MLRGTVSLSNEGSGNNVPSNAFLRAGPGITAKVGIEQGIIIGEIQRLLPVDNLPVGVMGVLGTERRPADQALKHDSSHGPPVTAEGVALAIEDLGGDVVGGTNGGVSDATTRLAPRIDLSAAHGEINLV